MKTEAFLKRSTQETNSNTKKEKVEIYKKINFCELCNLNVILKNCKLEVYSIL
jgi:tRNA U34 5-carboxymethylaminomethyl modifying enzyme MnmG/GidA